MRKVRILLKDKNSVQGDENPEKGDREGEKRKRRIKQKKILLLRRRTSKEAVFVQVMQVSEVVDGEWCCVGW